MTDDKLLALIKRNEERKRGKAAWRKLVPNALGGPNSQAADDIDALLAFIAADDIDALLAFIAELQSTGAKKG